MVSEECRSVTESYIIGSKLLVLESALVHHKMSTVIGMIPVYASDYFIDLNTQAFCTLTNKTGNEDLEQAENGLWYTTPERTICDMINYNRREDLIIEALDDYLSEPERFKGKEYLLQIAEKYNVKDKVIYFIDEIDNYFRY